MDDACEGVGRDVVCADVTLRWMYRRLEDVYGREYVRGKSRVSFFEI